MAKWVLIRCVLITTRQRVRYPENSCKRIAFGCLFFCIACGNDLTSLHKERRSFSEDSKGTAELVNCYSLSPLYENAIVKPAQLYGL